MSPISTMLFYIIIKSNKLEEFLSLSSIFSIKQEPTRVEQLNVLSLQNVKFHNLEY
jgi:hypothetical protein